VVSVWEGTFQKSLLLCFYGDYNITIHHPGITLAYLHYYLRVSVQHFIKKFYVFKRFENIAKTTRSLEITTVLNTQKHSTLKKRGIDN